MRNFNECIGINSQNIRTLSFYQCFQDKIRQISQFLTFLTWISPLFEWNEFDCKKLDYKFVGFLHFSPFWNLISFQSLRDFFKLFIFLIDHNSNFPLQSSLNKIIQKTNASETTVNARESWNFELRQRYSFSKRSASSSPFPRRNNWEGCRRWIRRIYNGLCWFLGKKRSFRSPADCSICNRWGQKTLSGKSKTRIRKFGWGNRRKSRSAHQIFCFRSRRWSTRSFEKALNGTLCRLGYLHNTEKEAENF